MCVTVAGAFGAVDDQTPVGSHIAPRNGERPIIKALQRPSSSSETQGCREVQLLRPLTTSSGVLSDVGH